MSRIFWDTNLFIYFFEGNHNFSPITKSLWNKMLVRGDRLLTSALTLGEVLVKPLARGDSLLFRTYEDAIAKTAVIIPFDVQASKNYASIRLDRSLKPPDAIQLACAASVGVDLFVTNDNHLQGKNIPGIQFIAALDRVPI